MAEPVRFGVVGLGMGASRARTVAQTEGAELVAVADINEERGLKAKEEHGCEWYDDYAKMLERDDIEVVMVMTPSGMHADMGAQAAAAGKHVVTTKPMDIRLDKADMLIEVCKKAGVTLAVDFNNRYCPFIHKIRAAIEQGLFGKLILGEARLKWWRAQSYFDDGWHGTWAQDGGGSLMNQTVHWADLLQWVMGPVESVLGRFGVFAHDIESEDLTMAMLRFKSGAVGTMLSTTTYPSSLPARLEVHGDKGGVVAVGTEYESWMTKSEFNERPGEGNPDDFPYEYTGPANVVEEMIGVLRDGKQPVCPGEEGRRSLELVLAIYESGRRGEEITLPL